MYRAAVHISKEKIRKSKSFLDFALNSEVSETNKQGFLSTSKARGGLKKTLDGYLLKMVT